MNKTERIFKIEQLIAARKVVSFKALLDELEISRATLKRDLEYLRSRMKAPIVYDRDLEGYRFDGKRGGDRVEFPGLWFNASEAAALLTMQHLLDGVQPGLLRRHVDPLKERLRALLASTDHSLDETLAEGYGIFSGKARAWAKLRFTPERARWVATEEWHPKQRAHFEDDGAYMLEFPYSDDHELLGDILRHGAEVEVLAPAQLRKKVAAAHTAAARRYT